LQKKKIAELQAVKTKPPSNKKSMIILIVAAAENNALGKTMT
jgi:hypothetical protein